MFFCWHPYEGRWWATGWNPEMRLTDNTGFGDPNVHNTIMIGCVDFYYLTSGVVQEDMYDAIKENSDNNDIVFWFIDCSDYIIGKDRRNIQVIWYYIKLYQEIRN